jgi:pimeloyl-ACP methyl ester carboxylesterase
VLTRLFAADRPLSLADLKRMLGERDGKRVAEAVEIVRVRHEESGIQLVSVAGGWQLGSIVIWRSGFPINVIAGRDLVGNSRPGGQRPDIRSDVPQYVQTGDRRSRKARGPSREDAAGRLFASLDPAMRDWAADRVTLHPAAAYNQPVKLARFWDQKWDADVLYCSRAPNPGEAHIRRAADKLGARWHVIDTGHYPMLSTPDELTRIILNA